VEYKKMKEYLKFGSRSPNWKKYARLCKNVVRTSWLSTLRICLIFLRFEVAFTIQLLLLASNLTLSGGSLKSLPSLKTYLWNMWHVSYYLYYDCAVSLTTLSVQLHIYSMQQIVYQMCSSKH